VNVGRVLAIGLIPVLAACGSRAVSPAPVASQPSLARAAPLARAGTSSSTLPEGEGRSLVQAQCMACHSADLLRQQRLTEAQWLAATDKMVRWGVPLTEDQKAVIVAYLSVNFGRTNTSFVPVDVEPIDTPDSKPR
jgi:mono/diheme cytochrome c family protein